jgi:hypothetical protein
MKSWLLKTFYREGSRCSSKAMDSLTEFCNEHKIGAGECVIVFAGHREESEKNDRCPDHPTVIHAMIFAEWK